MTALNATTAGATGYLWAPGGAITATLTPSVAAAGTTVYTVTVTGAGGCTATRTATIVVNPLPVATVSNNGPICEGQALTLTANVSTFTPLPYDYVWSNGTTTNDVGTSSSVTVTNSATLADAITYTVIITDNNGCSTTATTLPIVNANPTVTVNSPTVCVGSLITLTAVPVGGTSPYTYAWTEPGTGGTLTITDNVSTIASAVPGDAGPYTVVVTDNKTCKATATATVVVNTNPTVSVANVTVCEGNAINLTATATGTATLSYAWAEPGTGGTLTITDNVSTIASAVPGDAGIYTVTVSDGNTPSCRATATATVVVNANPIVLLM
ncbi:MAG: hypothetical protein IPN94_20715 [Sphingobacteriales bacterium]|nr:hypothetical protein [Sphingobacteriales bacterium]